MLNNFDQATSLAVGCSIYDFNFWMLFSIFACSYESWESQITDLILCLTNSRVGQAIQSHTALYHGSPNAPTVTGSRKSSWYFKREDWLPCLFCGRHHRPQHQPRNPPTPTSSNKSLGITHYNLHTTTCAHPGSFRCFIPSFYSFLECWPPSASPTIVILKRLTLLRT